MTLADRLGRADALCREGKYFEAHEDLEEGWMQAAGAEKLVLQGAVQVCAGLHRLKLTPEKPDGAFYLFERGLQKLEKGKVLLDAARVDRLRARLDAVRVIGKTPATFPLDLAIR